MSTEGDQMELWLPCPGHETTYEVSSLGRVRRTAGSHMGKPGTLLSQWRHAGRYWAVKLKSQRHFVHRLVCTAFHGPSPEGLPFALHRDDNRDNNAAANLYWGSDVDNGLDRVRNGRCNQLIGQNNPNNRLTPAQAGEIKMLLRQGGTERAIAAQFGVARGTVTAIKNGWTWKDVA